MSTVAYSTLLVLYVVALQGIFAPTQVSASPMPLPLMAADYSRNNVSSPRSSQVPTPKNLKTKHSFNYTHSFPPQAHARDDLDLSVLAGLCTEAHGHATKFKTFAAQSASIPDNDYDFQHDCALELTGFYTCLVEFQSTVRGDKGLDNYNRSHGLELETSLKEILKAIDVLVYNIPGLGPILEPIVYEIKCILDNILDFCENITNAVVDALVR